MFHAYQVLVIAVQAGLDTKRFTENLSVFRALRIWGSQVRNWVLPNAAVAATKLGICPCNPIQFSQLYEQDADISASQDPRAGAAASDFLSLAVACKLKSKHLLYLGEERELDMCIVWVCACARMCVFQNEPDSINKYLFFFLSFKQTS